MTMLTATPTSTLQQIVSVKVRNMSQRSIHDRILRKNGRSNLLGIRRKKKVN